MREAIFEKNNYLCGDMSKIPEIIRRKASENGFNAVEYIGVRNGVPAFSVGSVDGDGAPIPTGLPTVFLLKGDSVESVGGVDALDLL